MENVLSVHSPRLLVGAVLALLLTVTAAPSASAQVGGAWNLRQQIDGPPGNNRMGNAVAGAGDVNADGYDDLIIGSYWANPGGVLEAGSVFVHSGKDGSLLQQLDGSKPDGWFGFAVAGAGDVNGDGFYDVIIGEPGDYLPRLDGCAYVYSGKDWLLLHQFDGPQGVLGSLGHSVDGAGDQNGDGFDDLIVGAPKVWTAGLPSHGSAYVYSGLNGTLLHEFAGTWSYGEFGWSVASAGLVDGDAIPDLIVGAPFANTSAGVAMVFAGGGWSMLHQFDGVTVGDKFGTSVDGAGLVYGTRSNLVVGAEGADPGGLALAGTAYVYTCAEPASSFYAAFDLVYEFHGAVGGEKLGASVAGVGDVNGDGVNDFALGAPGSNTGAWSAGSAYLQSGADGSLLYQLDGEMDWADAGHSVAAAGDLNQDGLADVMVGAPGHMYGNGRVYAFGFDPFLTASMSGISAALGGSVDFSLDFPTSEAGMNYALLGSSAGTGPITVNGVDIPLTSDWLFSLMSTGNAPAVFSGELGLLNADGNGASQLNLPAGAGGAYIGTTFYFAAVSYVPATAVSLSSVAVPLVVEP